MSPPSDWIADRMTAMVASTWARMAPPIQSSQPVRSPGVIAASAPVLLAHQGGWDEVLLIGGPILVIIALLWLAKRRVDRAASLHGHGVAADGRFEGD
jgi:hypothetical protein